VHGNQVPNRPDRELPLPGQAEAAEDPAGEEGEDAVAGPRCFDLGRKADQLAPAQFGLQSSR
jgi:hypothetical protein